MAALDANARVSLAGDAPAWAQRFAADMSAKAARDAANPTRTPKFSASNKPPAESWAGALITNLDTGHIEFSDGTSWIDPVDGAPDLSGYVPIARTISAGAGLTGGGDLSANRSLAINYTQTPTWTGLHTFNANLAINLGSAALPSFYFAGDPNTGIWSPAADTLAFSTAGISRLRIDSAGKVGVGKTPGHTLDVQGQVSGGYAASFYGHATNGFGLYIAQKGSGYGIVIDANYAGNTGYGVQSYVYDGHAIYCKSGRNGYSVYAELPGGAGYGCILGYYSGSVYGLVGYGGYAFYGVGSYYTTGSYQSSDLRLKDNIEDIADALTMIEALRPVGFDWREGSDNRNDGRVRDYGFIAQEAEEILPPGCVRETLAPRHPKQDEGAVLSLQQELGAFLTMENSIVVPFLVRAVQQLTERVRALEAAK